MVALSMSPSNSTPPGVGSSPANASPSPTGGNKAGWETESLPSPAFATPPGHPSFEPSADAAGDTAAVKPMGDPPALALPPAPQMDSVNGEITGDRTITGKVGKEGSDRFAATTASPSLSPRPGEDTAAPSDEGRTTEDESHGGDACGDENYNAMSGGSTSSSSSLGSSRLEEGSSHGQEASEPVQATSSSARAPPSSNARQQHNRSVMSPPLPMQPPSACTTPSMSPSSINHHRRRAGTGTGGGHGVTGGVMGEFEVPIGSPWPGSSIGRGLSSSLSRRNDLSLPEATGPSYPASTTATVIKTVAHGAGSRHMPQHAGHEYGRDWRGSFPGTGMAGFSGVGDVPPLSPVSAATSVSPRAATNCSSPRAVSPRLGGGTSPRVLYPEGLEWWTELELSPSKVEMPGFQRWRDARRPSTLPSGSSGGPPGQFRHRSRDSRGLGSMAGGDVPLSEQSSDGLSPLRPSRLSRSYVTLLAAAAEEARAMTPGGAVGSGRIPGQAAHGIPRTDSSVSTSVMNAMAGGGVGSELGEVSMDVLARAGEERLRRLEAENLRLRFRVADLEGQVSVMEDELERRGRRADQPLDISPRYVKDSRRPWREDGDSQMEGGSGADNDGEGGDDQGEGEDSSSVRRGPQEPLLSPRGRNYLARLVIEVCSELEEGRRIMPKETTASGPIPRSERLCRVLPKVMETAIKGIRDLDEQVFEQMMQVASERTPVTQSHPPGTPARRLSSCVVARDGGGEFFAQSPAPGRPASFFRLGDPQTPTGLVPKGSLKSWVGGATPRSANHLRQTPQPAESGLERWKGLSGRWGGGTRGSDAPKNMETPTRWAAGEWLAAAFTPTSSSNVGNASARPRGSAEHGSLPINMPPSRTADNSGVLSFEGSAEEVLRYTIVAKSYLIRSRSKRHLDGTPSPTKVVTSPGGTAMTVVEGDDNDVRAATKELLDLKTRYMTATQHWLKTDIVNDEELRTIRAQVFEAIQRKRSELHREAAAVIRAERLSGMRIAVANGGLASASIPPENDGLLSSACGEEEVKRTINMLAGTAELLRYSRLLLLLSEAIAASSAPGGMSSASSDAADGVEKEMSLGSACKSGAISRSLLGTVPETSRVPALAGGPETAVEMTPEAALPGTESEAESGTDSRRNSIGMLSDAMSETRESRNSIGMLSDAMSETRESRHSTEGPGSIAGLGSMLGGMHTPSRVRGKGRSSSSPPLRPKIRSIDVCPE